MKKHILYYYTVVGVFTSELFCTFIQLIFVSVFMHWLNFYNGIYFENTYINLTWKLLQINIGRYSVCYVHKCICEKSDSHLIP